MDQSNVVALQHDPAQLLLRVPLGVHLGGVVQHQVHVLVKPGDVTLNPKTRILPGGLNFLHLVLTFS